MTRLEKVFSSSVSVIKLSWTVTGNCHLGEADTCVCFSPQSNENSSLHHVAPEVPKYKVTKAPQNLIGSHLSCKWKIISHFFLCSPLSGLKDWPLTLRKLSLFRPPYQEWKSQERLTLFTNCLEKFSSNAARHLHNSTPPEPAARPSLTAQASSLPEASVTPVLTALAFSATGKNTSISAQQSSHLFYFHSHINLFPLLDFSLPLWLPSKSLPWCFLNPSEDIWNSAKSQLCSEADLGSKILMWTCCVTWNDACGLFVPYALTCKV